jgi:hypothetical protein
MGKLDPRCEADTARHRCQQEATVRIDNRMVKDRPGFSPEMHVIPALDGQRNAVAEGAKDSIGPRSESDHSLAGANQAILAADRPFDAILLERAGLTLNETAATSQEQGSISFDETARVRNCRRIPPMNSANESLGRVRLALTKGLAVENIEMQPIGLESRRVLRCLIERLQATKCLDPACPVRTAVQNLTTVAAG